MPSGARRGSLSRGFLGLRGRDSMILVNLSILVRTSRPATTRNAGGNKVGAMVRHHARSLKAPRCGVGSTSRPHAEAAKGHNHPRPLYGAGAAYRAGAAEVRRIAKGFSTSA